MLEQVLLMKPALIKTGIIRDGNYFFSIKFLKETFSKSPQETFLTFLFEEKKPDQMFAVAVHVGVSLSVDFELQGCKLALIKCF